MCHDGGIGEFLWLLLRLSTYTIIVAQFHADEYAVVYVVVEDV